MDSLEESRTMTMNDQRLIQLKKKKDENDEDFKKRFGLTDADFARWKELTADGAMFGDPSLRRVV